MRRRRKTALLVASALFLTLNAASQASAAIPVPEMVAATPTAEVVGIASDGGNGVWFDDAELSGPEAGQVYMAHYVPGVPGLTRVNIHKAPEGENGQIFNVTPGANGDEWFTRPFRGTVARISSDGTVTDFPLGGHAGPGAVVVDSAGNVWVSIRGSDTSQHLDRLTPSGELSEWGSGGGDPQDLTLGPDGNLWIAGFTGGVSKISSTVKGQVTVYPLTFEAGDEYVADVASLGGKVWATVGGNASRIESISLSGAIHNYKLSGLQPGVITAGPDGAVWFGGYIRKTGRSFIGRLGTSGGLSKYILGAGVGAEDIAASPTAIYFTQYGSQPGLLRIPLSQRPLPSEYVALGDSYSSGEGDPLYEASSDEKGWDECHRSESGYPHLVDQELGLGSLRFVACSGAGTDDLFNTMGANQEGDQLLALTSDTRTVTLTIGGNDVGFPEVLEHCVEGLRFASDDWPYTQGAECSKNQQLRELVTNRLKVLEGTLSPSALPSGRPIHPLHEAIASIAAAAPNARIVIGGYPALFGPKSSEYESHASATNSHERACKVWAPLDKPVEWVLYSDARWLNSEGQLLDSAIQSAVVTADNEGVNVKYAPPSGFKGHGLCDTYSPWLHALDLNLLEGKVEPDSFHPTSDGQAGGYEPAFAKQLK